MTNITNIIKNFNTIILFGVNPLATNFNFYHLVSCVLPIIFLNFVLFYDNIINYNIIISFTIFSVQFNNNNDNDNNHEKDLDDDLEGLSRYFVQSPGILSRFIKTLTAQLDHTNLPIEKRQSIYQEIRVLSKMEEENIKELKAQETREQKIAKIKATKAKKKAALEKFSSSDLYSLVCFILGFDLKQRIKSLV